MGLRLSFTASFHYSILVTATLIPKLLHLYNHLTSLPCLLTILYLPTFFALDAVNAALFWLLVHLVARGRTSVLLGVLRTLFTLIILGASSVQIAFYLETGGEIKWGAASNFAHDPAGFKLLLSGGLRAMLVAFFITVIAVVVSEPLYNGVGTLFSKFGKTFSTLPSQSTTGSNKQTYNDPSLKSPIYSDSLLSEDDIDFPSNDPENLEAATFLQKNRRAQNVSLLLRRVLFLAPVVTVSILLAVRPRRFPYAHMSGSLPFTLFDLWSPYSQDMCQGGSLRDPTPFPLPHLISTTFWEPPDGKFVGWMPSVNASMEQADQQKLQLPSWLPRERIPGFDRWYHHPYPESPASAWELYHSEGMEGSVKKHHHKHHHKGVNYDPVKDPLHISNLYGNILAPITEAMKEDKIIIKHLVILSLESTRKDVFPMKKDSHLYDLVMKSHGSKESAAEVYPLLANMTKNAALLTGEDSGFDLEENHDPTGNQTWRNLSKEKGGLNIVGAVTGSTSTFKSMVGSHCGVQPLPIDFTVEAGGNIYQPCLPSILQLFNRNKDSHPKDRRASKHSDEDVWSRPWKSVFVQSITDQFDRQDELNKHIGFSQVISKDTLLDPTSKHYPPTERESNYFGFPESQAKPYLLDIFREAKEKNERLFLSHFTSSTHHPWNTPEAAGETVDYLKRSKWRSEHSLNRYLNTVKYGDNWIGEIMDMLDEFNMTNQTLVVMVGDHGYAFEEDSKMHSTFENGHISNFRVPLLFHHPLLPRIELAINATSLSIIPTILDLLITTSSLNTQDLDIASNLIHQYEGQSLIRPFVTKKNGRQQWNIGVINAGGALLSVSSAAVPFRLVLPVCKSGVYRFTDTDRDPNEISPIEENSISALALSLRQKYGHEASEWVAEAEKVGKWWVLEQRRRWKYDGASLQDDRNPNDIKWMGTTKRKHWWET